MVTTFKLQLAEGDDCSTRRGHSRRCKRRQSVVLGSNEVLEEGVTEDEHENCADEVEAEVE